MKTSAKLTVPILFVVFALSAAACGSDTAPSSAAAPETVPPDQLAGDSVVFVWTETGGCAMGGPNCARYEVAVDGTVETFRLGSVDESAALPVATGQVDPELVATWRNALRAEDIDALRERVGEGELTAAFDGVDVVAADPVTGVELSSVATAFDPAEPVFAAATALAEAAAAVAPLEIQMR